MGSISVPTALIAAGTAASVGSAIAGSSGAADTQSGAANSANDVIQRNYNTTLANLAPFISGGTNSLAALLSGIGVGSDGSFNPGASLVKPFDATTFSSSPGYNFQLSQGINAIDNSSAAKGGAFSGNTLKALTNYGQGVANQDYWNAYNAYNQNQNSVFNKLASPVGTGLSAATALGGVSTNTANQIGSNIIGAGNAQAAGQVGTANAISGGINGLSQNALMAYLLGGGGGGSGGFNSSPIGSGSANPIGNPFSFNSPY